MIEKRFRPKKSIDTHKRQKLIESLKTYFSKKKNVAFAYIHGSFAEGEPFRDIDVALYLNNPGKDITIESNFSYELSRITGYPVEVNIINRAPVAFQLSVLKKGILVVSKSEDTRADFIEDVSRRYREFSHFRNIALGT